MNEIDRLQAMRAYFIERGDSGMAAEVEFQLERHGVTRFDTPLDDTPAMKERAVSHKTPSRRQR